MGTSSLANMPIVSDRDPQEIAEWLEALDMVLDADGAGRCRFLLQKVYSHARDRGLEINTLVTPYGNTIAPCDQPAFPGDLEIEKRLTAILRWNALAMVVRANRESTELGGHLSSYASGADLFEVGFNHFFRGDGLANGAQRSADFVFFQPHSAPGIYARAFLEGRLTEEHLANYRREVAGHGLSSYPHPQLMPEFWQFPTGSMGLGPLNAIYQARFMRYLGNRNLLDPAGRRVWAFVGDGEMDEPESIAGLTLAARENLDNLTFVVNCNLQRLDGPVRGNSKIIQELERLFAGAGWNVIKLLWGSDWDDLFARDTNQTILRRLEETVDGDLQSYSAHDATYNRERFFNKYDDLRELVAHLSDAQIDGLTRGGHDPVKIHAAFDAAVRHTGSPTVVLAQTKKGYGLGRWAEGRMSSHQQKKLGVEALLSFRERFSLPLSDQDVEAARFYRPAPDSPEMQYLHDCRSRLGGYLPARVTKSRSILGPDRSRFADFTAKTEDREISTTMAFVRMLTGLLKDDKLASLIVPIVADEARTFGMESLFRKIGIYSHCGQLYEPADQGDLLYYKESRDGQILEEGITEAGALSSWIAAGTSYSNHNLPMLPFYIFYSMFGFQRVGDLLWAAADSRARGFLLGATAGRTTLSGEGLQHQDGTSHLVASTIPNCRAFDPCFAYEIAVILESGIKALMEKQEDVFYYLTLMNENYVHPQMPRGAEEGIVKGMYLLRPSTLGRTSVAPLEPAPKTAGKKAKNERKRPLPAKAPPRVQLLGSGTILREALAAADLLEQDWGIAADVWSVTSFSELSREGIAAERWNRIHANDEPRGCWVEQCLGAGGASGNVPVIAATDYVRAVPDLIRTWVPGRYVTLGTDGFGRSDTRAALRKFFEVDRTGIALAAIKALADEGVIARTMPSEFMARAGYEPAVRNPWSDNKTSE